MTYLYISFLAIIVWSAVAGGCFSKHIGVGFLFGVKIGFISSTLFLSFVSIIVFLIYSINLAL